MARFHPGTWRLATRIVTSALTATLLICAALVAASVSTTDAAMSAQAETQVRLIGQRAALALDQRLAPVGVIPGAIAATQQGATDPGARLAQLEAQLPAQLRQLPDALAIYVSFARGALPGRDYQEVWYIREGGAIVRQYGNYPGAPAYDPSQPLYDYPAMEWFTAPRAAGGTVWTEPYVDPGPGLTMVSAVTPVVAGDAFLGVAGVDLSLSSVTAMVDATRPTPGSYAMLVSRSGLLIANSEWPASVMRRTVDELAGDLGSDDMRRLARALGGERSGVLAMRDPRGGEAAWASYAPVGQTGWSIAVVIPQRDLLGTARELRTRLVGGSLLGLLLLSGILFGLARSIVRPLHTITGAAERLAEGDLAARLPPMPGRELSTLAATLNHLAEAVERSTGALTRQYRLAEEARAEAEGARALLQEQLATVGRQQAVIRAMSIPVLPLDDATLVVPLIGELDAERLALAQAQALRSLETTRARWLLLDITGITMVDEVVADGLVAMAGAARLLGARLIVVGVGPEVAQAMVHLCVDTAGIVAYPSLQDGIAHAQRASRGARPRR